MLYFNGICPATGYQIKEITGEPANGQPLQSFFQTEPEAIKWFTQSQWQKLADGDCFRSQFGTTPKLQLPKWTWLVCVVTYGQNGLVPLFLCHEHQVYIEKFPKPIWVGVAPLRKIEAKQNG